MSPKDPRPESEKTAAEIKVGGAKLKISRAAWDLVKKWGPYVLVAAGFGGGVHAVHALADGRPAQQESGVLADHDARLGRLEDGFHNHVLNEQQTILEIDKRLGTITDYILNQKKDGKDK